MQERLRVNRSDTDGETGFVLIGVVWLLLLGTAIVALLMLRGHEQARSALAEGSALQNRLNLDAATESATADILIRGGASDWVHLPANGSVQVGGSTVDVTVTSEDGRLDLNDGDLTVIDSALQGLGYATSARTSFVGALKARRAGGRITSVADMGRLLAPLQQSASRGAICLADIFTLESGRNIPDQSRMPRALISALGVAAISAPAQMRGGESLRIVARSTTGSSLTTIARLIGLGGHPLDVAARYAGQSCR